MEPITVQVQIDSSIQNVWQFWTNPEKIILWNFASDDWCCPAAKNDLHEGGEFSFTMAAKDGSMQFEFNGTYTVVKTLQHLSYLLGDGRTVQIDFKEKDGLVELTETFDPESENSIELQRFGWQAILNNFKAQVEKAN
jgi:uncharacterized protein YndB with AHSA1/START domain